MGQILSTLFSYISPFTIVQIAVAVYVIRYVAWLFADENTRIPSYKIEAPKIKSGKITKGENVLGKDVITCYNPATLEILCNSPVMSPDTVKEMISKAKIAQKSWSQTSFAERRRVLRTLMNALVLHKEDMARISVQETGKTAIDSIFGEVFMTLEKIRYIINTGEKSLGRESRSPGFLMHKRAYLEYVPYGVIGIIIPWNFPIHNAISHLVTAIFSGNACVIKVSEWASWSVQWLRQLTEGLLKSCGHSPDLIQYVTGYAETGQALVSNADKILFIGSPQVGKKIMEHASKTLTPVTLELGGKDPFIVLDDAPLDYTVQMAMRGAFLNCGQNCLSAERFYVYEKVHDAFLEKVLHSLKNIQQGPDSADNGAVNLPLQFEKYAALIKDAVDKGATLVSGGKQNPKFDGHFWEPTVLINVDHSMKIAQEEIFGPIMSIIKIKDDAHLLSLVNKSDYGLSCSIFSKDQERALRIGRTIESGSTVINDWGIPMMIQSMPFGGVKISGFGKFNGPEGLRDFCYQKVYVDNLIPWLIMPPPDVIVNHPVPKRSHLLVSDFCNFFYGRGIAFKIISLFNFIKRILTKDYF
eukprot:TRINITY_DN4925_c0_g1_i1.p1 TRINITY_DN4925_c0_g1~~TRINITY_DN4925_c0_g1_i1.p1  ORF type:complete len:601 (-),score=155.98 TRINITY_DN4925_c0_g1_i1:44-1795(-)